MITDRAADDVATTLEERALEFARVFRAAARAVAFYPPAHPAARVALDALLGLAGSLTATGPICFTILPAAVLVEGKRLEQTEAIGEFASLLHRQSIGAITIRPGGDRTSWQAFLRLLARHPEEVRNGGGIERAWAELGGRNPVILAIDFGELLRGRVGGEMAQLAGLVGHYLSEGGVVSALPDAAVDALEEVLDGKGSEGEESAAPRSPADRALAIVHVLRGVVQLVLATAADRLGAVFARAATVGARLTEPEMSALLALRGSPEGLAGTVDVVGALVDRMSNETIAQFVARAVAADSDAVERVAQVFAAIVPDVDRRAAILVRAQDRMTSDVRLDGNVIGAWESLRDALELLSDRRFVSDEYARELQTAGERSVSGAVAWDDPPAWVSAWFHTIEPTEIERMDVTLLADLLELETDPFRWRQVLDVAVARAAELLDRNHWAGACVLTLAVARDAGASGRTLRQPFAAEALARMGDSRSVARALASLARGSETDVQSAAELLGALGSGVAAPLVMTWSRERAAGREMLRRLAASLPAATQAAFRALCESSDPSSREAALALLESMGGPGNLLVIAARLGDPERRVRTRAMSALLVSADAGGADLLVTHMAAVDGLSQERLLDELLKVELPGAMALLPRVASLVNHRAVRRSTYLALIERLAKSSEPTAVAALSTILERARWWGRGRDREFARAAAAALARMAGSEGLAALARAARDGSFAVRRLARHSLREVMVEGVAA